MAVRSNGAVRDLRAPLADGEQIQILTTRDRDDPDALYVLRHSTAHLLAEAVRRLYPGVKLAIGPPIENGFYYDFEFPEPIHESDLERIEAEIGKELEEGRSWSREEISREEARARFEAENEPYKVELVDSAEGDISLYTQGDFTDLCRGPHLQDSKPIKAVKLTGLAGAYWRGDEKNTQLTRIYGTAFYTTDDLAAHLAWVEEARARDHRVLGRQLDLFHLEDISPGSPFWHPKGMVIWNILEDLRRRENAKRGYVEVKTPLIYDKWLWETSGHWEKFREHMFQIPDGDRVYALKPMNCPGHMRCTETGCGATASSRCASPRLRRFIATSSPGPSTASPECATSPRTTRTSFAHASRSKKRSYGCIDFTAYLYELFGLEYRFELSTRPEEHLGTDEEWDFTEGALRAALERRGLVYELNEGDGAFYGPKIDLHMTDVARAVVADGHRPTRCADAAAVRSHLHGRRQHGAHAVRDPPCELRLARAVHRHPDRALRGRLPAVARAGAGADPPRRRDAPRRRCRSSPPGWARPAHASRSTTATRRSAGGSGTRSWRRSRAWSSTATASRPTRWPSGSAVDDR